jgi:hypothetical protein
MVRHREALTIAAMICVIAPCPLASAGEDWQAWFNVDAGGELNQRVSSKVTQSLRWKDGAGGIQSVHIDLQFDIRTFSWLDVGVAYREVFDQIEERTWLEERRPYLDLTLKWKWEEVSFTNRNRFEWRDRESSAEDEFRYRNKLTVLGRNAIRRINARPYAAGEVFFGEDAGAIRDSNRVRLTIGMRGDPEDTLRFVGLEHKEGRKFKGDVFVHWETTEMESGWEDLIIVGAAVGVFF